MANLKRTTVGLLFVGGSTLDGREREVTTVTTAKDIQPWLRHIGEVDIIADTVGWFVASGERPIGADDWRMTVDLIKKHYDQVDGFVVLHQLESLPAGITALSLMLRHLGKPVVVVGSPLPAPHERGHSIQATWPTTKEYGAKASFINAIQVAISDVAEVVAVYGSHVLRGASVVNRIDGERSRLDGLTLGKIDFGIRFFSQQVRRGVRRLQTLTGFESRVTAIEFVPGMTVAQITEMARKSKGVFLSSPEAWRALQSALPELQRQLDCPIAVYAPDVRGTRVGLVVSGSSRTNALITFMWALGQSTTPAQLKKQLRNLNP